MQSARDVVQRMAADMGMLPSHLDKIIRTAPLRYKVFYIPKKSGGLREVAQPAREVKAIQRWLIHDLEKAIPVHESATAYRPGLSIRNNAELHADSNFMLKLDFTNFFPSILRDDICRHLERHCSEYYDETAQLLIAHVCCWVRKRQPPLRLCIGAPSSPLISNSLMYEFDCRLADMAKSDGVVYSRYADDITLSSIESSRLDRYIVAVNEIISELSYPKLIINERKTVRASRAGKRVVTGLLLTPNKGVSVGRDRKRLIRSMYHRNLLGKLGPEEVQELNGLISFVESIEPGFSERLKKRSGT